jgi:polysaccharide deacetylase 2 family uncharacterized protein YibQ
VVIGGYFYIDSYDKPINLDIKQFTQTQISSKSSFEQKADSLHIEYADDDIKKVLEKPEQKEHEKSKFHFEEPDYGKVDEVIKESKQLSKEIEKTEIVEPKVEKKEVAKEGKKPRLAIIIDDVTTSYQVRTIQNLGYKVNMAFLPPTSRHPNSAKVAQKLDQYMIHLPLQASSFKYEEEKTLYINDSLETIDSRIEELKKFYPKAKYINNHTGSKFTANEEAMDKLFQSLKKHGLIFIDSRTTAYSVAKEMSKKHQLKIYSRNTFLDNNKNKEYIQNQLKKAIKIAKRTGLAIAIGHPYGVTFETLKDSKHLLEGLEMIYVDEL